MSDKVEQVTCPACGAHGRNVDGVCALCGSELMPEGQVSESSPVVEFQSGSDRLPGRQGPRSPGVVYCNDCGWKNPLGSRFCARCGTALQEFTTLPAGQVRKVDANDFRQKSVTVVVGGVLLVVALFTITSFSKLAFAPRPTMQGQTTEGGIPVTIGTPLAAEVEQEARSLRESAEAVTGATRAARLAELVNLYLSHGAPAEAAAVQEEVAMVLESAAAWADAGNLYYQSMQEARGSRKRADGQSAIVAYGRSLEIDPDNLDVRTDMATAYLATENPMEGVRQLRHVLDENPEHVQANFNYGVMLSMIGQTEQAIAQFERVVSLVEPGSDIYRQAQSALNELRRY